MRLHTEIILLVGAISLSIGVLSAVLVSAIMHEALERELEGKAVAIVQTMAEQMTPRIINRDVVSVRETLQEIVRRTEDVDFAFVVGFEHEIFAHSFDGGFPRELLRSQARHDIVRASAPHLCSYSTEAGPVLMVGYPLIDGMTAHVHVGLNQTDALNQIRRLRNQILFVAICFALLGTLVGMALSRRITRPIGRLSESMRSFAEGKVEGEMTPAGGQEMVELAQSFNWMIAERTRARERIEHLNLSLRAVRNVNQLITHEKDRDKLINGACENLTQNRGYYHAWVVLLDESKRLLTAAESGLGERFERVIELLKQGELTPCGQAALAQNGILAVEDVGSECKGCPLSSPHSNNGAFVTRLEYRGKIYGLLGVSIRSQLTSDEEERSLFTELADDIAFALYNMELEEERKRAVAALRESEERYRAVVEDTPVLICRFVPGGEISFVNEAYCKYFAKTPEDLVGQTFLSLIPEADREAVMANISALTVESPVRSHEHQVIAPGGEIRWQRWANRALFDALGQIVAYQSIGEDITERKRAEESLRAERDRLRSLMDGLSATQIGVDIVGVDYRVISQNQVLLDRFGDLTGKLCYEGYMGFEEPCDFCPMTKAIEGNRVESVELTAADGRSYQLLSAPFPDPDGTVDKVIEVVVDTTERKRAEEALGQSEERFRAMFETMTSGVAVYEAVDNGEDFVFKDFNRAGEQIDRAKREDIIGKRVTECFPGVKALGLLEVFQRVWKTGKPQHHPVSLYKDERIIGWRENSIYRLPSGEIVAIYDDVTERKQAEEALRRLAMIAEQAGEGIAAADLDGNLTFVNSAWARMHGYEPAELIGEHLSVFHNEEQLKCEVMPFNEEVERSGYHAGEIGHVRRDGTPFPAEMTSTLLRDAKGKPVGLIGFVTDITERKRAEEALRESEKRYRLLAENISDMVWVRDLETMKSLYMSPSAARLTGFSSDEAMSRTIADALTPGSLRIAQEALKEETELEESQKEKDLHRSRTLELEMRCKDRSTVWTETRMTFLRDENDKAIAILGVSRDITERKQAEERLLQAQKMEGIGRLAGGIAHDFNNLLTSIVGNLTLLKMDIPEDYLPNEEISEISRAAIRASDLTQQLLAFSRKQLVAPQVMALNEAIKGMTKMLRRLIREDIEILTFLEHDLPAINADPTQVEQVILNLALNGRDAMPHGGKLTIETDSVVLDEEYRRTHPEVEPGPYVVLVVTDTGAGMDAETMSHVFEPFYTTKQMGRGTGLGLSTVYGIVKQSGGSISVYSEKGRGACFNVYFPAVGEKAVRLKKMERKTVSIVGRGESILVVEDEEPVMALVERVLSGAGYDVKVAADCEQAIALAQDLRESLDLLLTDVVMPDMGGRDLVEVIGNVCPTLRTLFMSGYTHNVIAHSGVLDEGVEFISKPFSPESLLRKVREVLDK